MTPQHYSECKLASEERGTAVQRGSQVESHADVNQLPKWVARNSEEDGKGNFEVMAIAFVILGLLTWQIWNNKDDKDECNHILVL